MQDLLGGRQIRLTGVGKERTAFKLCKNVQSNSRIPAEKLMTLPPFVGIELHSEPFEA
jgi:hypothetical protein